MPWRKREGRGRRRRKRREAGETVYPDGFCIGKRRDVIETCKEMAETCSNDFPKYVCITVAACLL